MIHKPVWGLHSLAALLGAAILLISAGVVSHASSTVDEIADSALNLARPAAATLSTLSAAPQLPAPAAVIPLPDPVWRIGILTDGLYSLSYAQLVAAGVPVTEIVPADLHLLWRGQPIAIQVIGDGDGRFDPADGMVFYGQSYRGTPQDEKYTDEAVYWLAVITDTPGLRMGSRDVAPGAAAAAEACTATVLTEQNWLYWARFSTEPGTATTWFWNSVNIPSSVSSVTRSYPIPLTAPITQGYQALLVVELASRNSNEAVNPDHHVRLRVNSHPLGDFYWDGAIGHVITTTVPATALIGGVNTLEVTYLTDVGHQYVYFDRATLTYRQQPGVLGGTFACRPVLTSTARYTLSAMATDHLYDVGDPARSVILSGGVVGEDALTFQDTPGPATRYMAEPLRPVSITRYSPPDDLIAPVSGADAIVIAPRLFLDALQPLIAQRNAQGVRTRAVAVEDVFALWGSGVFHPEAIRAFVAHAVSQWPGPAPQYLFLVGDGNFNLKGYNPASYGVFVPSLIPPYLEFADPYQGEVPVDSRFGDIDGDGFPELSVGRLPARTVAETEGYVAKLLAYEAAPQAFWQARLLMVADNGTTSDEGFADILDRLARSYVPDGYHIQRVYMRDYCSLSAPYTPCPLATQLLLQAWESGAALLTYAGHGAIDRWANEPLLVNAQLADLRQTTALPFLLSLDCWDGYWMYPPKVPMNAMRSVGEWVTTVLTQTGAVAAFGPAGLALPYEEELLARAIYAQVLSGGVRRVGDLAQVGRQVIASTYMARTYTLLGDPTLELRIGPHPLPHRTLLPIVMRSP